MPPARRYTRITSDDTDYGTDYDPRFDVPEHLNPKLRKPNKKTVALALGLLFVGSILLACYALYATGRERLPPTPPRAPYAHTRVRAFNSSKRVFFSPATTALERPRRDVHLVSSLEVVVRKHGE